MAQLDFSGLWIPLVTPMRDGLVDESALRRLVQRLADAGVRGFVACGSTGEAHALSTAEQMQVLDVVVSASGSRPVIMGLAGTQAQHMTSRLRDIALAGAQAVLVSAPYYLRPAQAGLIQHFEQLAEASELPIVLYDVPARTGVSLTLETLLALAAHANIQAIKDCGSAPEKTRALIADGRLAVLAGNDDEIFCTMAMGGAGAITASAHVCPEAYVAMVAALQHGDLPAARRHLHALTPLTHALFAEPNPSLFKAALAHQGWMSEELRAPHSAASRRGLAQVLVALERAQRALAAQSRFSRR